MVTGASLGAHWSASLVYVVVDDGGPILELVEGEYQHLKLFLWYTYMCIHKELINILDNIVIY